VAHNLKIKTAVNIGYNTVARVIIFLFSGLASIILARNLEASDYGVVGFAFIITGFLSRFSDLGINSAMIQRADLDLRGLNTGFTVKMALGLFVFLLTYAIAPLSLYFLDHPATPTVIRILALNFLISSFALIPTCILTRGLNYRKLFIPQVGSALVNSSISIALALMGFKYWAIVIANITAMLTTVVLLNVIQPVKLNLSIDKEIAKGFIRFGGNLFGSGLIVFVMFNADNFIIGSVMGAAVLGFYALAFNWGSMICSMLAETVHNVLFPTFAKIQQDSLNLKNSYLKVMEYTSFVGILANLCLFVVSEEFLYFILGQGTDKWLPALSAFRILCVYGIVRTLLEPVGNVIMALGLPNLLVRANLIAGAFELILLYPTLLYFGIEGVATLVTVAYATQYLVYFPYLRTNFDLTIGEVMTSIKPALICFVAIMLLNIITSSVYSTISWMTLFGKVLLCLAGYLLLYGMITNWKLMKESRALLNSALATKVGI
jgi:lipopolysaccharide exporter